VLTESRIINDEYLEDAYPQPRLCPEGAHARARIRSSAGARGQAPRRGECLRSLGPTGIHGPAGLQLASCCK